jgi:hypothetical protein
MIGPFLSMEVLCGFSKMIKNFGIIRDWEGKLGEVESTLWESWEWSGS